MKPPERVAWLRGAPLAVGFALCLGACYDGDPSGVLRVSQQLAVGVVGFYHADLPNIVLPESAPVGDEVLLTIDTFGNACWSLGPDEIRTSSMQVFVTPFDRLQLPDGPCDDLLLRFRHRVPLVFENPGRHRVTVLARERPNGPVEDFEYEIFVY